jgi:Transglycosylase SLT domain
MDYIAFTPLDPNDPVGRWAVSINTQARAASIPPCLLAAIVQRESGGENILEVGVPPGPGCGAGLCQITSGPISWAVLTNPQYKFQGQYWDLLDPSSNLFIAARAFLKPALVNCATLVALCPQTTSKFGNGQLAFYVACSYNAGFSTVTNAVYAGQNPDFVTTFEQGSYYGSAVLATYEQYVTGSHTMAGQAS